MILGDENHVFIKKLSVRDILLEECSGQILVYIAERKIKV